MSPGDRRAFSSDTAALARDPVEMPAEKRERLAAGSTARDGDPQGAVRPDAEDVAARPAYADELHRGGLVGLDAGAGEKRKIELHAP